MIRARLAIGVITHRRPRQFVALLAELAEQNIPAGTELLFIFVENDSALSVGGSVDNFAQGRNVHLELEPKIGIPFARNRVLDIANRIGADWLIWIDDDDLPTSRGWVDRLYQGCKNRGCTIGYGFNIYPNNRKPSRRRLHHGTNAIFEMAFLREHGLRYNVSLPVGEDVQFGLECVATGALAGVLLDAIVEIGGGTKFDDAWYRFRRARDKGMVRYGFQFRHLEISHFHPVKTPVWLIFMLLKAILNLLLAVLFVPGAKVRAARDAGIVAGAIQGCCNRQDRVP